MAYYCFDDLNNLGKDCSGNNNDGYQWGGVSTATGVRGGAANFGGFDNPGHIRVVNSASLQVDRYLTIAGFVKLNSEQGMNGNGSKVPSGSHVFLAKSHDRAGYAAKVLSSENTTASVWLLNNRYNSPRLSVGSSTPYALLNDWLHVAYVISKDTNTAQVYLNGELAESMTNQSIDFSIANQQDLFLGKYSDIWYPLNGMLDEIRLYNRALSSDEIKQLIGDSNAEPSASFTATPASGSAPLTVTLDASASSDSDGTVVEYHYTINGQAIALDATTTAYEVQGGSIETVNVNGSNVTVTRRILTVVFKTNGNYTVGLKVKDNSGLFSSEVYQTVSVGQNCSYSISPTSKTHSANAETGSVTVTASHSACAWTASSNQSWSSITAGSSRTGSGTVSYSVQANTATQRTGTLTIAGKAFNLTQSALTCSYSLSPTSKTHSANAETGSVTVTASHSACAWTASSNQSWSSITAGSSRTGSGTVSYSVQANTATQRTGTLTIAGKTFNVTQSALTCSYSLSPTSKTHSANAETGSVTVTASHSACAWTASSNQSWSSITAGSSRTGSGTVSYSVQANTATQRTGTLTIAGKTFNLTQTQGKQAPIASFTATPDSGPAPLKVTLDYSASNDPDGQIVKYDWTMNGSVMGGLGTSSADYGVSNTAQSTTRVVTFYSVGTYVVGLKVTDNDGLTATAERTVTVTAGKQAPIASFTATPDSGPAPLKVTLDYSASNDPDGQIVKYDWTMNGSVMGGLGTSSADYGVSNTAQGTTRVVTFYSAGTYVAGLKVTDNDGLTATAERTVTVTTGSANLTITPSSFQFAEMPLTKAGTTRRSTAIQADPSATASPNRVIFKFKPATSASEKAAIRQARGATLLYTLNSINAEVWQVADAQSEVAANQTPLYAAVDYVEPDYVVESIATPNDSRFGELWGMHNSNDADIDASEAWNITRGSADSVCAVIDTGVDYTHPDLAANMWKNPGEIAGNGKDDDGNGYIDDVYGYDFYNNDGNPMDDHGHGTHVAGTMAGVGNNGSGVVGVNWTGKIVAVKFLSAGGSGSISGAIRAIEYANKMKLPCTNNSWGGGGYSQALADAIAAASQQGSVFVAAAGNSGLNADSRPMYPAAYNLSNVVSVCATDNRDALASFSNYGQTSVDLCAPGVAILSALPNNQYAAWSGTSMASPHVAGAAMLLRAKYPYLKAHHLKALLMSSVDKKTQLTNRSVTGGRLNAYNALRTVPAPHTFTVTNNGSSSVSLNTPVLEGAHADSFVIQSTTCQSSLAAHAQCGVTVAFAPNTEGAKQATLNITANASTPVSAALSGNAQSMTTAITGVTSYANRLTNISVRCHIQPSPKDAVAGFVIDGTGSKKVLLRGLQVNSLSPALDMQLTLYRLVAGSWQVVTSNDNWRDDVRGNEVATLSANLIPTQAVDAALLMDLEAGVYTAIGTPKLQSGIGIVGVDDLDDNSTTSRLTNISGRCAVEAGQGNAIAGFVVQGGGSLKALLRGLRVDNNMSGALNPKLELVRLNLSNGTGDVLERVENWGGHARAGEIQGLSANLVPRDSRDAAILRDLEAGNPAVYTVSMQPMTADTGVGIVSVDAVD